MNSRRTVAPLGRVAEIWPTPARWACSVLAACSLALLGSAATITWDGGAGTGAWGTGTNWSTNSVPATTDNLVFNAGSANGQYNITLGGNRTTLGIVFSATGANGFTFNDGSNRTLTLNGSGLVNNNTNTQTFGNRILITVNATQTWDAASGDFSFGRAINVNNALTLTGANDFTFADAVNIANATGLTITGSGHRTFNGTVVNSGGNRTFTNNGTGTVTLGNVNLSNNNTGRTFTLAGTGTTTVSGTIGNGGNKAGNIIKSGTGTAIFSGSNTYTGTTTVSQGTLQINANAPSGSAGALGNATSAVVVNNASTGANNTGLLIGASGVTIGRNVTVANSGTGTTTLGGNFASGTGTFSGTVALNRSVNLNADGTSSVTFSNTISGAGGITKTGTGTVIMSGSNKTYTGTTTVSQGTLQLNINSPSGSAGGLGNSTSTVTLNNAATGANNTALLIGASGVTVGRNISVANNGSGTTTLGGNIASGTGTFSGTLALGRSANLNADGTSNITFSNTISGAGAVTKTGAGAITLSGTNNYSGGTTLSAGTLAVGNNSALGSGTLTLNAGTLSASGGARSLTNAVTVGGNFTIGGADNLELSGNMNLGGGLRTITVNNTGTTTFSGIIGEPWNSGIAKAGDGLLVLSGANTFTGIVEVNDGTLRITNNNSLGAANTWTNVIASGATLELLNNINVAEGGFNIAGTGHSGAGAIHNYSGTNTLAGQLQLTGATTINSSAGALTLSSYTNLNGYALTVGGAGDVTFSAQVHGDGAGSTITKQDSGTLTLNGSNSHAGVTTISGGTLVAGNSSALGTTAAGTTIASGATLGLTNNISIASGETIGVQGTGVGAAGAIRNISGNNTLAGAITLAGNTTFGSDSGTLTLSGAISGTNRNAIFTGSGNTTISNSLSLGTGSVTKNGSGTLTFMSGNTYSGGTTINAGTLNFRNATSLGTGTVTVNSGATLEVQGGGVYAANALTLAGGTLRNVSGDLNWLQGAVTVTADSTIYSATVNDRIYVGNTGNAITLGTNTLTIDGPGKTILIGAVGAAGEAGNVVINSTGDVWFNSQGLTNNFTGTTTVNRGTLYLGTNNHVSFNNTTIRGNLIIGNGTDTAAVVYPSGYGIEKIADTSHVTINRYGTLNLNSSYDTIGGLTMNGGAITLGSGGTLVLTDNFNVGVSDTTSTIAGYQFWLTPSSGNRTINVADGSQYSDLLITASVASGNLVKTGDGRLTLAGNNIYTGTTSINQGVVNVRTNTGLGSATNGTTVASGAALELQKDAAYNSGNDITIANEALTLNGTGISNTGALRNLAGNNTWGGVITLASNSRINSDADRLTINGSISSTDKSLTVGGAGATWINGVIGTAGGLTKDGTGTLTLTGNNNYSGATTIDSGIVNVRHSYGLGSVGGGVTVASGAALQLQADPAYNGGNPVQVGAEALSLSGTGIGDTGALRNIAGNNSYGGAITVASASTRINSDSGTLTLGGTVALGNNTLTVGGAGNTTITGQLTGTTSSDLVKDGAGTLTLSNNTNTFAGDVSVTSGTLAFGANNSFNNSNIDVSIDSGATMSLVQYAQTIGTLAGLGAVDFGTSGSLTLMGNTTFSGSFSGTGTIIVSAGVTLTLGADFNASGVTIQLAGGTLNVNGSNSVFAGLSLTGNSIIDFDSGADSTIQFTNLSLGSYGLEVYGWVDTQDYFLVTNQPGTIGQAPLNQVTFGPSGGPPWVGNNTTWQSWDNQVTPITPVPEPSTYGAMLMAAGLGLFGYRRWRQQRAGAKK